MKRFEFRLERILQMKKKLERLAELHQQRARAEFEAATARVDLAEQRVSEAGSGGMDALRKAAALGSWQTRYELVASLEQEVTTAREQANHSQQLLLVAQLARTRIATEVEVLDRLRQDQFRTHREEVTRREYEQLDEVGMRRWLAGVNTESDSISTQEEDK